MDLSETASYLKRINQIRSFNTDQRMNEVKQFYNTPSFWQIMNIARKENSHSAFIAYYLNPGNHHSLGDSFLRLFLQLIAQRAIEQDKCHNDEFLQKILLASTIMATYIQPEEFMQGKDEKGRFDIFMKCIIPMSQQKLSESDKIFEDEEFIVIVENKVSAKETKGKTGRGQTAKYKEFLESKYKDKNRLMILLSPDRETTGSGEKGVKIECEDFIRVSYQDLLTHVIEPILNSHNLSGEDEMRLKDYVKCLSIPALEEGNNDNKKTIIMAMSAKETKLLMDFWNNNEDLIKACLSAIASNDEFSDDVREIAEQASSANFTRDTTKYSFKDKPLEKMSRSAIVPAFIEKWANQQDLGQNMTFDETLDRLTKSFPASLRGGKKSTEEIIYPTQPRGNYTNRFPSIKVGAHTFYVSANIWTKERFAEFLNLANKLAGSDPDLVIVKA